MAQIAACIARPPTNILFGALRILFVPFFYAFHLRKKPTVHLYKDACKAWHIPEDVKQFVERKSDAGSLSFKEPGQKFQSSFARDSAGFCFDCINKFFKKRISNLKRIGILECWDGSHSCRHCPI